MSRLGRGMGMRVQSVHTKSGGDGRAGGDSILGILIFPCDLWSKRI
jgi:hypothetical protein